ncbi:P1 family peptidase [Luteimonas kalidii]|uniref:P1 family peptidase n=1 Tax=Luteimonas kalidii TaxID=3042025 RepID=A0ABT6JWT2_9GAMM|nr:P1 family peptidase [Luteimonas kalidii]MDH5835163.1 P1 family peptidase [Luteimonas kalidii]
MANQEAKRPQGWLFSALVFGAMGIPGGSQAVATQAGMPGAGHAGPEAAVASAPRHESADRPRAREAGVVIGVLPTGPRNAIVDVPGVAVGHATVVEGAGIRTGVTAILPHGGDLYRERVPAAIVVGNGYGKLVGVTQVDELGELETPILLTGTLAVWRAADALVSWQLARPGMADVRSLNPVVGETNDGYLNDIRARPLQAAHVVQALESASVDNVEEGAIGAGTGTVAFGWKGGIGTSSRRIDAARGGYTVGVLVQSNYGGRLTIGGVALDDVQPVRADADPPPAASPPTGDGSVMIVIATDAPLDARLLRRLGARALLGIGRTGGSMSNGSGDYVIAFATAPRVRAATGSTGPQAREVLPNDAMTPLFDAVVEATEEAVVNSLFRAHAVSGHRGTVQALPLERVVPRLRPVPMPAAGAR